MQWSGTLAWQKALYMIPKIVLARQRWICKNCTIANLASLECHCAGTLVEVVPRDSENIQNSNPARLKYPAFAPSPVPLLANFLRRNNFSVYCLQSCIMFRSWRRQIFCLIFRSMASAGNFLQGISNSPWKSNLCGNDFVQNSISQRILYLFLKIFKSICEKKFPAD